MIERDNSLKKTISIIVIIAVIGVVYLYVQNQQLQSDLSSTTAKANELNEYIDETSQQTIHFEASDVAEHFVSSYFEFSDYPEEKDVEDLITDNAKEELSFGEGGQHAGEDEEVKSSVKNIESYFGEATDNRQEIFIKSNNLIEHNDVTSEKDSYLKMDMVKSNDDWKIDDVTFDQ